MNDKKLRFPDRGKYIKSYIRSSVKWLYPNLKIKRWFLLAVLGIFLFATGFALMLDGATLGYVEVKFRELIHAFTGDFPRSSGTIGVGFILFGIAAIIVGFSKMMNSIISILLPEKEGHIVDTIYNRQHLRRGPKIVVIGGGTGLSALLRGLKEYTGNLTAIVTVADDGGSSGKLRDELGVLPPGDVRNCLVALAERENVMEELFSYRFESGTLAGHSMGNLLLAGMANTYGDFQKSIEQVGKIFALCGTVYPSTLDQVVLSAKLEDGRTVQGETKVRTTAGRISRVFIEPADCQPVPGAIRALEEADLVVLGPGSLYTSVLPNLLVEGLRDKIRSISAPCVYVCNVMTEPGETDHYSVADHVKAIVDHTGKGFVDAVLANNGNIPAHLLERYAAEGRMPVKRDPKRVERLGVRYFEADLIQESDMVRHDSKRLARELIRFLFRLTPGGRKITAVDAYLLIKKLRAAKEC